MKSLFRICLFLGVLMSLLACELASQITPTPVPLPSETPVFRVILLPSSTAAATATPALRPTLYNPPTFLPTIEPTTVSRLLGTTLSIQTSEGTNGQGIRRITGWEYGFRQNPCCGYQWLDSNHLLLYPRTGEGSEPYMDGSRRIELSSQPVIVNLENGHFWQPRANISSSLYVARELGIVFQQQSHSSAMGPVMPSVVTYTFDGQELTRYWGKIMSVSPSGEKILVDEDTIIDLRTGKINDLAWHMDYDLEISSKLYWSSDETRIYRCCFYYADLKTEKSYNFEWSDLRGTDGKPVSDQMHAHTDGQWVRNDRYFLVKWDYLSAWSGDPIPLFSPMDKKYYDLAKVANIPSSCIGYSNYTVSPDGMYVWVKCSLIANGETISFLVNLTTFKTISYHDFPVEDFVWSPDSKFAWLTVSSPNGSRQSQLLSVSNKEMTPLNFSLLLDALPAWHPTEPVLVTISGDGQELQLLNAQTMAYQELVLPIAFQDLLWSPNGDHIALIAADGSLWQVDYPKLENLEQLTRPLPNVNELNWSPDGNSIAFINGPDIYIVDTMK